MIQSAYMGVPSNLSLSIATVTECPGGCRLSIRQSCRADKRHTLYLQLVVVNLALQTVPVMLVCDVRTTY
jgi:hypothetical protein